MMTALYVLVAAVMVWSLWRFTAATVANKRTLVGIEQQYGNQPVRRRLAVRTARDRKERDAVLRAEYARGWVWLRVRPGEPRRGARPEDCQIVQVVYARTRVGAIRRARRAQAPSTRRR